jgi:hypothetical protein
MPLNCFDPTFRRFEENVLSEANRPGIAVFGMKSLAGSGEMVRKGGVIAEEGLRYCHEPSRCHDHRRANEIKALRDRCRPEAADGRYELFKMTKRYDGDEGRKVH